jgi:hypothetical protein
MLLGIADFQDCLIPVQFPGGQTLRQVGNGFAQGGGERLFRFDQSDERRGARGDFRVLVRPRLPQRRERRRSERPQGLRRLRAFLLGFGTQAFDQPAGILLGRRAEGDQEKEEPPHQVQYILCRGRRQRAFTP